MKHGVGRTKHKLEGHVLRQAVVLSASLDVSGHGLEQSRSDGRGFPGNRHQLIRNQPLHLERQEQ